MRQKMNIREEDSVLIVASGWARRARHFSRFSCLVRYGRRRANL